MYNITETEKVLRLPEDYKESNHISLAILNTATEPGAGKIKRQQHTIGRSGSTVYILFKLDDQKVWVKEVEFKYWQEVLSKVDNKRIAAWYVAGSIQPSNDLIRTSGVDSYELHFLYNERQ